MVIGFTLLLQAELEKAVSSHGDTLVLVNFFSMRNSLCTSFMTVYEVSIRSTWIHPWFFVGFMLINLFCVVVCVEEVAVDRYFF
jgi:hypothetical protein